MDKEVRLLAQNLIVYSFAHAVIDCVGAIAVFSIPLLSLTSYDEFFNLVILYGLIAFGLQVFLGLMCDKFKAPKLFSLIGILFMFITVLFISHSPIILVILAGIANALLHVGGGTISLNITPKKATAPGIFVAPGTIGLFIGLFIGKQYLIPIIYPLLLLVMTFILIFLTKQPKIDYQRKQTKPFGIFWLIVIFILVSVIIRSFIGFMIVFPWKSQILLSILFTLAVFAGKALGGYIGDKIGWMRLSISSLLISAFLLGFFYNNPIAGIIGILLFNMTMPITLVVISNVYQGRPGFAFGLTVLALIIGALPMYAEIKIVNNLVYFTVILFSTLAIFLGLHFYNKFFKSA